MATYIPEALRAQIQTVDRLRCAYCQTSEANSGIALTFDHIQPQSKGGPSAFANMCLACRTCNEFKSDRTVALDPLTESQVLLFQPRMQTWVDHFAWSVDGTRAIGLTAVGRATIIALAMNNPAIVAARTRWVAAGWHPPAD